MSKIDGLLLQRYSVSPESTLGLLYLDNRLVCYTLEDTYRDVKIAKETRIPAGIYKLDWRTDGDMVKRYRARYKGHGGMNWLKDVPGFEWVYIHVGNSHADTEGCILVGSRPNVNTITGGFISESGDTYTRLYADIRERIPGLTITIRDEQIITA